MASNMLDRPQLEWDSLQTEVDRLVEFIEQRFPAEAAGAGMTDRKDVIGLAMQLLQRLWRWEH